MPGSPESRSAGPVPRQRSETGFVRLVPWVLVGHLGLAWWALTQLPAPSAPPPPDRVVEMIDFRVLPPTPPALPPPLKPPPVAQPVSTVPVEVDPTPASPTAMALPATAPAETGPAEPTFLPQSQIQTAPGIPAREVLSRIHYPDLAAKMGLEAVVILELFIDATGQIRRIQVLKDPGNGFAEAAVTALQGLTCTPAQAEGRAVAVRFRYPVRFTLK